MIGCSKLMILALALPGVAFAATPAAKQPVAASRSATAAAAAAPAVARRVTLSAEGNAAAARVMAMPDPRVAQIQTEIAAIRQEKGQFISGSTVDVDKLEPILRREEALQTELRAKQNDRLLALLRALPDADRVALLNNLANPARPQAAKPAETGR